MKTRSVSRTTLRLLLWGSLAVVLLAPAVEARGRDPVRPPVRRPVPVEPRASRVPFAQTRYAQRAPFVRAHPETRAEREFVEAFRLELEDAIERVASNPQQAFPQGSLEAHLKTPMLKLDASTRAAVVQRARTSQAKRRATVSRVQPGVGRRQPPGGRRLPVVRRTGAGLSADMRQKLQAAVLARLDYLFSASPKAVNPGKLQAIKTFVEVGVFSKEFDEPGTSAITIHQPEVLEFRWWTEEHGAQEGKWQLLEAFSEKVLAEGSAGDAPKRTFKVHLGKFLPPEPPDPPRMYHLRVQAWTKPSITKVPGPTAGSSEVVKKGAERLGPRSQPVVITYGKSILPPEKLDFPKVYRKVRLRVHDIHMIEDQDGPGSEEFHVAGFVQEFLASGEKSQHKFGPYVAVLDPDGPRTFKIKRSWQFNLNNPDQPEWPRTYLYFVSVIEEDIGDGLADWRQSVQDAATTLMATDAYEEVVKFIEDYLKEHGAEVVEQLVQVGAQLAQLIAAIASEVSVTIVGMAVAAAVMVITAIISNSADDYYGTEAYVLPLLSSRAEHIHGEYEGMFLDDGVYRLKRRIHFRGYTQYPQATKFDGQVEVRVRIDFSELVDLH